MKPVEITDDRIPPQMEISSLASDPHVSSLENQTKEQVYPSPSTNPSHKKRNHQTHPSLKAIQEQSQLRPDKTSLLHWN